MWQIKKPWPWPYNITYDQGWTKWFGGSKQILVMGPQHNNYVLFYA